MKTAFDSFTSKARTRVLRTLYFQEVPIPLRHVALISDLPVYSVQNALESLFDEGIITRTTAGSNVLFALNRSHPMYPVFAQLFIAEINARIRMTAELLHQKAKQALSFASSARTVLKRARRPS